MAVRSFFVGVIAYRIAPCGVRPVFVNKLETARASVSSRVGKSGWAKAPMWVARADIFESIGEARSEYRRRRAAAIAANPSASLNLTTDLREG
jgi:hypothetical protein